MALNEEKLILFVSQYPELYDLRNEHYMNSTRKNNIWKEIAKEMGIQNIMCKEKWKGLRDSYHRNIKRRQCKSGDGATKNKKWKYESQMEFLRPYLQERTTKTNIEDAGSITSDDIGNENSIPDLMAISPEPANSLQSSSSATSLMFQNITARKKNQTQQLSVASVLQNYLDSRPASTTPTTMETRDPIHSFFGAMADSVTSLPPDLQLKAKNKIYAIVSELEYENLLRKSTSSTEQAAITKKTTPSTSDPNKQFFTPQNTPTSRPQNIQGQQIQIASDNVQYSLDYISDTATNNYPGGTDKGSPSMLDINRNTQRRYILTSDGFLLPQEVTNDVE